MSASKSGTISSLPPTKTSAPAPRRRRLTPEARRQEIIDAARALFSQRPLTQITTDDVAKAAGVSRALVHSYFGGGIRNVFLAVVAQSGTAIADARELGPDTPLQERLEVNIDASLEVVSQNRETWWAVMGHRSSGDAQIDALAESITEYNVQRTLDNNKGSIPETPVARAAIRALVALSTEVTRLWFTDQITREQAHALLVVTYRDVIRHAIPAMEDAAAKSGGAGDSV